MYASGYGVRFPHCFRSLHQTWAAMHRLRRITPLRFRVGYAVKTIRKSIIIFIAAAITGSLLLAVGCADTETETGETSAPASAVSEQTAPATGQETAGFTAFDAVREMGAGWNLGNALDCIDNKKKGVLAELGGISPEEYYETYWGNPLTTAAMINAVADAGFGAVRVPVTYADHMDGNFLIRPEWLDRVEQVVNYVLDNDMYCVINMHHDTGSGSWPWLRADPENIKQLEDELRTVWLQIAGRFADYGDRLIFEGFSEILDTQSRWNGSDTAAYGAVNRLNQVFVDTVRGAGGCNADRFLIVSTYAAGIDQDMLDAFVLPDDSAENRLIAGVHYYGTIPFAWRQEQVSWTDTYPDWDPQRDGAPVEETMKRLNSRFVENGIPVIIGEFGAKNKNNTEDRVSFAKHYTETAKKYGIACFWWDDGGKYEKPELVDNYAIFDRTRTQWYFPQVAAALVTAAAG